MAGRTGLRSEIIVNIVLLLAAALLFAGFLLIKLTERELLAQRVSTVTGAMEMLARSVLSGDSGDRCADAGLADCLFSPMQQLPAEFATEGWGAADSSLELQTGVGGSGRFRLDATALHQVRLTRESHVLLNYPAAWPLAEPAATSNVVVTVPLLRHGDLYGLLQAKFSLAEVRQRVATAQRLVLLYTLLYGAVLVPFGVYILSRAVLRPVRRLQAMSQRIAAGDLEQAVPVEGPMEIAELARSFNAMTAALRQGELEREAHIRALQQANAEVRQAQDDLIRSEKMASVGHLAAGMAHEIGNPLGAVVGYLEYLKGEAAAEGEKEIIERALAETGRIDRLVRELLDYAAPADGRLQLFDPVGAMAEARDILAHQGLFDGVVIDDRLPVGLPPTRMARHKLVQVCINLLLNARDALAAGGTIRLSAGEEGKQLWLAVTDTGTGIDAEVLAHIFDPFYSTKEPGKGRGLGLAVCQRVIGEAGGRIEVASVPGEGTEFRVWLAQAEHAADEG